MNGAPPFMMYYICIRRWSSMWRSRQIEHQLLQILVSLHMPPVFGIQSCIATLCGDHIHLSYSFPDHQCETHLNISTGSVIRRVDSPRELSEVANRVLFLYIVILMLSSCSTAYHFLLRAYLSCLSQ